jgi:anthranilate 1,2-dioxygenase ferredoxin subunit
VSEFITIAGVEYFPEEKLRRFFIQGNEIGVVRYQGKFYAYHNRCTHSDFQLHFGFVEDGCLWCPIHYGVYDLASGRRVSGPVTDLKTYEVRVQGDEVQVNLGGPPSPSD